MIRRITLLSALAALAAAPAPAQVNPRGEAKTTVAEKKLSIEYGRPSLKGRDMLAEAEVGAAWRLGADGPTTLESEADLKFGDVVLPKGSYILRATKLAQDQWQLNVHRRDAENPTRPGDKVADVPLALSTRPESTETFTIELRGGPDSGELEMKWGTAALKTAFKAN